MTDTQEAMREAFALYCDNLRNQRQVLHHATNIDLWRDNGASFEAGYKAGLVQSVTSEDEAYKRGVIDATRDVSAQSAAKIARLEAYVKQLEEVSVTEEELSKACEDYLFKAAAAELSNRQLREEFSHVLLIIGGDRINKEPIRQLLKKTISTEALDAYVNEEIKRRQDAAKKFSDCLPQFKGDTMHPPTPELAPINQDEPYHEQR